MSKTHSPSKRTHSQVLKALQRHSTRVKILRRIVPVIIVFIVLVVLLWTSLDIFFEEKIEGVKGLKSEIEFQNKVMNPELRVTDDKERPVKIQAESATHDQDDAAHFEKPCCELEGDNGNKSKLTADEGLLDRVENVFTYRGNVVLDVPIPDQSHVILKTKSARVFLDSRNVDGEDEIHIEGPMGTLTSKNGFRFDHNKQKLTLKGPSRLKLQTSTPQLLSQQVKTLPAEEQKQNNSRSQ